MTSISPGSSLVFHDSGATQLILPYLNSSLLSDLKFHFEGPARALAERQLHLAQFEHSLEESLQTADVLISGTGWASNLEHNARCYASKIGLYSIAVIDHWVNYEMRFERDGIVQLPNEIWVFDRYAFASASEKFPSCKVVQKENLYLRDQVAKVEKIPSDSRVLYLTEPLRAKWGRPNLGEFQCLEYAIENLQDAVGFEPKKILMRLHPSEPIGKYASYIDEFDIDIDDSLNLAESITASDVVVGAQTAAMVVALLSGRRVISSLPPWAPRLALPHDGIEQMRKILEH